MITKYLVEEFCRKFNFLTFENNRAEKNFQPEPTPKVRYLPPPPPGHKISTALDTERSGRAKPRAAATPSWAPPYATREPYRVLVASDSHVGYPDSAWPACANGRPQASNDAPHPRRQDQICRCLPHRRGEPLAKWNRRTDSSLASKSGPAPVRRALRSMTGTSRKGSATPMCCLTPSQNGFCSNQL